MKTDRISFTLTVNYGMARLSVIDQVIVPSEHLVIVNTWNEKYIAVQESEDGVHVYMDGMDGRIK